MDSNEINQSTGLKGVFPGNQIMNPDAVNAFGVENSTSIIQESSNDTKTYIRLETKNSDGELSGVLEVDLISFREKGLESRYLSINTVGAGVDAMQSETTLSIDNEVDFNRFKKFISELNWND